MECIKENDHVLASKCITILISINYKHEFLSQCFEGILSGRKSFTWILGENDVMENDELREWFLQFDASPHQLHFVKITIVSSLVFCIVIYQLNWRYSRAQQQSRHVTQRNATITASKLNRAQTQQLYTFWFRV